MSSRSSILIAFVLSAAFTVGFTLWREAELLKKITPMTPATPAETTTATQTAPSGAPIARQVRAFIERFIAEAHLTPEKALQCRKIAEEYIQKLSEVSISGASNEAQMQSFQKIQIETNRKIESLVSPDQYLIYLKLLTDFGK